MNGRLLASALGASAIALTSMLLLSLLLPDDDDMRAAGPAYPRSAPAAASDRVAPTASAPHVEPAERAGRPTAIGQQVEAPAPEPEFELGALLAHDDAHATAEVIVAGALEPQSLLARILNAGTPVEERELLIEALALASTAASQQALTNLTLDGLLDAHLLDLAYEGLGHARRPTPETLAHLRRSGLDPRQEHRVSATRALGLLAREAEDPALRTELTRELLADLAEARDPTRQLELIRGVAETGNPQARETLGRLADAPDGEVRALAGIGLGRIPGPEAEVLLLTLLESGTAEDRAVAAEALASRAPTAESVGALCEAGTQDRAFGVSSTANAALLTWARGDHPQARTPAVRAALAALTPQG